MGILDEIIMSILNALFPTELPKGCFYAVMGFILLLVLVFVCYCYCSIK